MENKDNHDICEHDLQEVSGGGAPSFNDPNKATGNCFFTVAAGAKPAYHNGVYSLECGSFCWSCSCHKKNWCVDKRHRVSVADNSLLPSDQANHSKKTVANNYNT